MVKARCGKPHRAFFRREPGTARGQRDLVDGGHAGACRGRGGRDGDDARRERDALGWVHVWGPLPVFTDDPLAAPSTVVKAIHFTELRDAIDTLRTRFGVAVFTWTDATVVVGVTGVKAVHLTELRAALNDVYVAAGRTAPTYTDAVIAGGVTVITATLIAELRAGVVAIWWCSNDRLGRMSGLTRRRACRSTRLIMPRRMSKAKALAGSRPSRSRGPDTRWRSDPANPPGRVRDPSTTGTRRRPSSPGRWRVQSHPGRTRARAIPCCSSTRWSPHPR